MKFESKYKIFIQLNASENVVCEMAVSLSRGDELMHIYITILCQDESVVKGSTSEIILYWDFMHITVLFTEIQYIVIV